MIELINFYKFFPLEDAPQFGEDLYRRARCLSLRGTLIVAREGCNLALCGRSYGIDRFLGYLMEAIFARIPLDPLDPLNPLGPLDLQAGSAANRGAALSGQSHLHRSSALEWPYRRLSLQLRSEIVASGSIHSADSACASDSACAADSACASALTSSTSSVSFAQAAKADRCAISPEEFQRRAAAPDTVLVDMRNHYEWAIGSFQAALRLPLRRFSDLPQMLPLLLPYRERELLTFCTGGIRCEKAVPFLQGHGFTKARQLAGGILGYLAQFPEGLWEGECFVFDQRVSVNARLERGSYQWCRLCGQPAQGGVCVVCGNGNGCKESSIPKAQLSMGNSP